MNSQASDKKEQRSRVQTEARDRWLRPDVFHERVRQLYENSRISLITTFATSLIFAFLLRNVVPRSTIVLWIAATSLLTVGRYWLAHRFFRSSIPHARIRFWYRLQIMFTTLSGMVWGIGGVILFPENDPSYQLVIPFLLGGLVAGAVGLYSVDLATYFGYSIPTFLPIIVYLLLFAGGEIHVSMGVLSIIFSIVMMITAYRMNIVINTSLERKFENVDLISELAEANERLQTEVKDREVAQTEAEESRERADNANKSKSEFLANMSHEIRTPMNAIIGMADLLKETPLTDEQQQYVQVFGNAGENLLNVINDILDISKVEAGHLEIEAVPFNLDEITDTVCEILAYRAHEKGLELICNVKPDVPLALVGDPVRLRQILMNLIGNAIKFTEKGEIRLEAAKQENKIPNQGEHTVELMFSVTDTGIGIPEEKTAFIFDIFRQADSSTSRKHGGTGLGLSISKSLVELMDGRIWVESIAGKGSTFYFTSLLTVQAEPGALTKPVPVDLVGLRTLIVDDNDTNRMILREMMLGWGATIREAENGTAAINEIKHAEESRDPFRLVLLDVVMPEMDGYEVARIIRGQMGISDMTIIMLTSDYRPNDSALRREIGIAKSVAKPVRRAVLHEVITTVLGHAKADGDGTEFTAPAKELELPPLHILLVEDNEDNVLLIQSFLKKTPCTLEFAGNGKVAVDKFVSGEYDLVLMDMQMPVMDGYAATQEIRKVEKEHGKDVTPIIALTAYATPGETQKSIESGCTAHLTKPIKKARLIEAIREHTSA